MEELLDKMLELRESAYKVYREGELTGTETSVAYADGVLEGIDMMMNLVKDQLEEK